MIIPTIIDRPEGKRTRRLERREAPDRINIHLGRLERMIQALAFFKEALPIE